MNPTVYVDQDQCEYFGHDYFSEVKKLVVAADTLLKSKGGDGYSRATVKLLKPLGGKTLVLFPSPENGPGWFTVSVLVGRGQIMSGPGFATAGTL